MSVRTIEASTIRLAQITSPSGEPAITVSNAGVVSLTTPSGDAGNEIASTTYVQEAIANATGTLSLNTTGSYQWTGNYQVFNNNQIITIGDNLTEPPTLPVSGETCDANQVGVQIENNVYADNETDFLNYGGDQVGGFSFSTITDSYPLKQNLEITNNGSATILNVLGVGSDIQVNSASVLVPDPASQSLPNTFTDSNTFEGTTILDGPLEINNPSTVTDVMTFEPNTIKLINPTYPVGIGQVLLGPQGNIQLLNNQSTKGVTIQSGTYATSMLVDNLSNLNLRDGLVVTGNASANNITSANNISTATMTISGIATAPTAPATTNTDQLATCAFVLQNQSASTGAEVGFPNTFTATQTFQANSQYPTNINLSRESQIDEASITYNNQVTTLTSPFTFNLSDGINTTVFKPLSNGGCNNNGSAIINQTALNTALSAYPTTASLGTTFAQLTGATFTGDVITPSISATTGTINSSPIITNATITPALSGYAQLSSADFLGTVTAPTIRSTGAISCLSGTINGFPIVSKNNLDTALTAYANLTTANSFTGGTQNFNANNGGGTITETGLTITQNLLNGGACQDIVALNGGYPSNLGLAIWCGTDSVTNGPQTPKVQFYNDTTFTQFNGGVYSNGTLNTTALGITNGANAVGLYCNTGGVLRVEGNVDCNGLLAVGTTTGTFNSTGTSTCPTVTVDDKYPTTDIVNATSLINYVNSQTATSQYFVGQLISGMFPSNSAELLGAGFLYCDGSPLDSANPAYTALYNVIGINYGTSGGTIFYLPDFTGRMALGGNIEQGVGVPVPQFLNQDTQRNQQYSGVYGGYVGTGDFPFHYHPIVDNGHQHSANINWSKSNNANDNQNLKFNSQDGAQQAMVTNTSFTGITQTEIVGSSATIGVMNPYTAVNWFIYAGAP